MVRNSSIPISADFGSTAVPTVSRERIRTIDMLRGFALLGVVLINVQWMISWESSQVGVTNTVMVWLLENVVAGKFFRLFAFLFGLGFALQMTRLESRGVRFVRLYLRRLLILFLIGLAHGVLFWPEDILAYFAQMGILLLLVRRLSNRWFVVLVVASLLSGHIYHFATSGILAIRQPGFEQQWEQRREQGALERKAREEEEHRVRSGGNYREVVEWNTRFFIRWRSSLQGQLATLGEEFVMLLLGLYAGRRRVFENIGQHLPFIRRVMWWGLVLGVTGLLVSKAFWGPVTASIYSHLARSMSLIADDVGSAATTLCYASAFTLLLQNAGWKNRLAQLAPIGRMALTHYLMISLIVTTLFYSYGFGLYGKVSVTAGVIMAVTIFALQILLSVFWLERFRFGPAEWLWRSLTYGERQPIRNTAK